jgi:DNA-directed RNA polymerase I and III subunit RPAC1
MDDPTESRERAHVNELYIEDTAYCRYPGNYWGIDDSWRAARFRQQAKVNIERYYFGRELEMDIFGIAPAIANAYRRIMLAEVPTMAFEHVFIKQNTSVIQDEMLAHRLGMIPLKVDPTKFDWRPSDLAPEATKKNHTIAFELKVKCEKLPDAEPEKSGRREDIYKDYKVYSKHLRWIPILDQGKVNFRGKNIIRPVHQKILIAKLSGNQEIDLRLHAVKGIGRDHAKFSPVATATYKLMPDIRLKERIVGEQAKRLQESFSHGVIELVGEEQEAKVVNARIDSGSRNIFRHADLKDKVQYDLIKDHYIFNIESTGAIPALDIFLQSCDILGSKCEAFLRELKLCRSGINNSSSMIERI